MSINFKVFVTTGMCAAALHGCTAQTPNVDKVAMAAEITSVLSNQDAAWNGGDIDAFMQDYWKSEELRFASAGTINRGWQATLDSYIARYPDKATMGELSFSDLEIKILSHEYVQVFGHWKLVRENDTPGGLFTLLFQKIDGKWLIVSDHTSSGG